MKYWRALRDVVEDFCDLGFTWGVYVLMLLMIPHMLIFSALSAVPVAALCRGSSGEGSCVFHAMSYGWVAYIVLALIGHMVYETVRRVWVM